MVRSGWCGPLTHNGPTGRKAAMSLAVIKSRALDGLAALPVQVEVHLANGLPSFTILR